MRATCCVSPGSRLDEYEELMGLPLGNAIRGVSGSSPGDLMTSPEAVTSAALDRRQGFFFLAEITMRRMLNRSKETRRRNPHQSHFSHLPLNVRITFLGSIDSVDSVAQSIKP